MYLSKPYHFAILLICTFYFVSCNKEIEKPEANIPYFTMNDTTSILPNSDFSIKAGCKDYKIQPKSEPEGASVFIAINDNAFSALQKDVLLHDSIRKISAYAIHPGHEKSSVVSLNINFESNVFAGTTALFPNPASDYLTLRTENSYRGLTKFTLLDIKGIIQYTTEKEKVDDIMEINLDLSDFNIGLYIYNFEYEACELMGKVIVAR